VPCAGIIRDNLLFKMTDGDWDAVVDTHLKGTFHAVRAAQRHMVEQHSGKIVLVSSTSALGNRGQTNYSAAKAGLQGMTKTLAIELGPYNSNVNCVAPGFIVSAMTDALAEEQTLGFINQHISLKERPVLAGNSIHQDRRFIRRYMPALEKRLHYRMVDVSTIKELARRWYPQVIARQPAKRDTHRALDDIRESIDELRFYRGQVFLAPPAPPPG
jgi:NAD(P)-dependent dehydrogenase (short-subunit alcohol dehydrogenase family)